MTWSINFSGHIEDRNQEKAVADVGRKIVAELKALGLTSARFVGNQHSEDYLAPKEGNDG
jgi:hypothetical protein